MLRSLGYRNLERFHMNEGHAALLTARLLVDEAERGGRTTINREDIEAVRKKCVFTTHTPVPAGHDRFPMDLVSSVMRHRPDFLDLEDVFTVDLGSHILGRREAFPGREGGISRREPLKHDLPRAEPHPLCFLRIEQSGALRLPARQAILCQSHTS